MSRRSTRRPRRTQSRPDPVRLLNPNWAWRAADCSSSGGVTVQWNPYIGSVALTQAVAGSRAAAPAASALLGGLPSANFSTDFYGGTVPLGSAHTVATVCTITGNTLRGVWSSTNGTINTGSDVIISTSLQGRRFGNNDGLDIPLSATPYAAIVVAVFTESNSRLYQNARTPDTTAIARAGIAQSSHYLGAINVNQFPYSGEIAEHIIWNRALTQAECEVALVALGARYKIAVGA